MCCSSLTECVRVYVCADRYSLQTVLVGPVQQATVMLTKAASSVAGSMLGLSNTLSASSSQQSRQHLRGSKKQQTQRVLLAKEGPDVHQQGLDEIKKG